MRNLQWLAGERAKSLSGKWNGYTEQKINRNGDSVIIKYNLVAKIEEHNGGITGDAKIFYFDTPDTEKEKYAKDSADLKLTGIFQGEKYLKVEYRNEDFPNHFGEFLVELSEDSTNLKGRFLGHGLEFDEIVEGIVILNKADRLNNT